jgi:hypothetical protein
VSLPATVGLCMRLVPLSTTLGTSHQAAILAARVQLRHCEPCLLAVELDEDLHDPFVPYLAVVGLAPHADFGFGVIGHVDRSL